LPPSLFFAGIFFCMPRFFFVFPGTRMPHHSIFDLFSILSFFLAGTCKCLITAF
jgi:hypothetical protein